MGELKKLVFPLGARSEYIVVDFAGEFETKLCFRIATIGTTSSGKSTIVNALIGRRIAPIEAGEMSGGVLTL